MDIFRGEVVGLFTRLKNRDFSGNTGAAFKNSIFTFILGIILKFGSLFFTIILIGDLITVKLLGFSQPLLSASQWGLYSLAISTIILFSAFSDLGIGTTLVKFLSKELAKKKGNPQAYINYLFKLKIILTLVASFALFGSAYFIQEYYYHKPIFLALLAGSFYLLINSLINFYTNIQQSRNKFEITTIKEVIFQVLRLILVPLAILIAVGRSDSILLFYMFIALNLSYLTCLIFLIKKTPAFKDKKELTINEKREINSFILPLSVTIISGFFFGSLDMIILGSFVSAKTIGIYSVALALIGSIISIISFAGALLPILSKLDKEKLELFFKKSIVYTIIISSIMILFSLLLSKYVILIIYGKEYLPSVSVFNWFTLLLILDPLIGVYSNYFIVKSRQIFLAKTLIASTFINILLVYLSIKYLITFSEYTALFGALAAVITSRFIYLLILILAKDKKTSKNEKITIQDIPQS